jgi:hypothetical protein
MENKEKKSVSPLAITVTVPIGIAPSDSGDYVAQVVKKKHNILIVPYTIAAIKNAVIQGEREKKKLRKVQLILSQKSSPAELSFEWAAKKS